MTTRRYDRGKKVLESQSDGHEGFSSYIKQDRCMTGGTGYGGSSMSVRGLIVLGRRLREREIFFICVFLWRKKTGHLSG
jgi:hypothetical protein